MNPTVHGPIYWLLVGWWWGPTKWLGRVGLWIFFWPIGLWRSHVHHTDNRDAKMRKVVNRQAKTVNVQTQAAAPKAATTWAPPAGWRPDPTDPKAVCWWDGQRWLPETKRYQTTNPTDPELDMGLFLIDWRAR